MNKKLDNVSIRIAREKDISRIREIYNEAIRERTATCDEDEKSLSDRKKWFAQFNNDYPIYVLCVGKVIAAYGCLFRYSPKSGYRFAVENSVYVAGEFR